MTDINQMNAIVTDRARIRRGIVELDTFMGMADKSGEISVGGPMVHRAEVLALLTPNILPADDNDE